MDEHETVVARNWAMAALIGAATGFLVSALRMWGMA